MNSRSNATIVSYVSSPHTGYLNFFRKYEGGSLYVLGTELISEFPSLVRHLPGNTPEDLQTMIESLHIFSDVQVLEKYHIPGLHELPELIMPDEDVSHALAERYFNTMPIRFDDSWRLRWDRKAIARAPFRQNDPEIAVTDLDRELMRDAVIAGKNSSDWWRQVGAVLVKDGRVLFVANNQHVPSEQSPYLYGDPRSNFEAGQCIDISTALHAEIALLTAAARGGISTNGCDLYVTTFPCPPCAYACANAGLRRLFYAEGYSLLEGAAALTSRGVELVRVVMGTPSST